MRYIYSETSWTIGGTEWQRTEELLELWSKNNGDFPFLTNSVAKPEARTNQSAPWQCSTRGKKDFQVSNIQQLDFQVGQGRSLPESWLSTPSTRRCVSMGLWLYCSQSQFFHLWNGNNIATTNSWISVRIKFYKMKETTWCSPRYKADYQ